jgi:SAM-dependent methyltransferase
MTLASREPDAFYAETEPATWMPARYREPWKGFVLARAATAFRPGIRVLDVGSGARPAIPREQRPEGCVYVGLDISASELERAGADAYDELIVGDICSGLASTISRFDLVLSWQVLEHVASMRAALATQHAALVPGGRMVGMLSGAWSIHALAARVIPYRLSTALQARLLNHVAEDKFPTSYDGCTDRALRRMLAQGAWRSWEVVPYYRSGNYLCFLPPLQRLYVAYESWAARRPHVNLATHYIVDAVA